ncbi:RIB2 [Candida oxycetoniae]|uniref:RIB2 n=1 Tax=Candida oxycetoniae TaxID=497107 RepID=A0AAI9STM2_9ASCO|nr:RIB2 [Candida oxycetoniae]KAI3402621.2 RIB2 [Candida oxycetoniae]
MKRSVHSSAVQANTTHSGASFRERTPQAYARAMAEGLVTVNNIPAFPKTVLKDGDLIQHSTIRTEPPVSADPIGIVYEDNDWLVIDKPSGIPAHPAGRYTYNTVTNILFHEMGRVAHPCNRLDRLTSGLMFLAKTRDGAERLTSQIRDRTVRKKYLARVKGLFPGRLTVNAPLYTLSPKHTLNVVDHVRGKPAETSFQRLMVHLQYVGHPIANDPIYSTPAALAGVESIKKALAGAKCDPGAKNCANVTLTGDCARDGEDGARDGEDGARDGEGGARDGEDGARDGEDGARDGEGGARDGEDGARDGEDGARDGEGGARDGEDGARDGEDGARDGEGGARDGEDGARDGEDGARDGGDGARDGGDGALALPSAPDDGDGGWELVISYLDSIGKTRPASSWFFPDAPGEMLIPSSSPDDPEYSDPGVNDLSLWLHAYSYSADDGSWSFSTRFPAWATEPAKKYMRMAIEEAKKCSETKTMFNVGCVLVNSGDVIAKGYSRELPGNTHAEQCAIQKYFTAASGSNNSKEMPPYTEIYTTMEPCSKRLSGNLPCVDRILALPITSCFVGVSEPETFIENNVSLQKLTENDVFYVHVPGLEKECLSEATRGHPQPPVISSEPVDLDLEKSNKNNN